MVTDTGQRPGASTGGRTYDIARPSAWAGWVVFAGVIMIMMGTFHAILGLVALFREEYYVVPATGLVINVDYSAWGWTHLILGVIVAAAGFGVIVGQVWARAVGVVLAMLSALVNMAFVAAYPVWSILVIAFDVIVIYALIVHSRDFEDA